MKLSNKSRTDIALEEMRELVALALKYSPKQIARMAFAVEIDDLHDDMVKHEATEEEIRAAIELSNDVDVLYWEVIDM